MFEVKFAASLLWESAESMKEARLALRDRRYHEVDRRLAMAVANLDVLRSQIADLKADSEKLSSHAGQLGQTEEVIRENVGPVPQIEVGAKPRSKHAEVKVQLPPRGKETLP